VVISIERKGRGDEETFKVIDNAIAERAIELSSRGLGIENEAVNGSMEGLDIQHQTMETLDEVLEFIVISPLKSSGEPSDDMGYQLNLSTPKRMIRKKTGTPAVQLARIKEALEVDEDMELENEVMRKKSAKKGNGKLTRRGVILNMLQKKIDIFEESTEPRKFKKVRSNLFATHPPIWKLEDS